MSDGLIIAVCGDSGAGKSTTTGLLRDEGFAPYSLSAFLRQEAEAAIDTPTREQVQSHGKNQQERHGNHYYAEVLIAKTDLMAQRRAVIDGLRNLDELDHLRRVARDKGLRLVLLALVLDTESRFQRVQGRARAGDPALPVRGLGAVRQPVRVVWSRHLDLPLNGQLAATARQVPVWLCHGADADPGLSAAWRDLGAEPIPLETGRARQIDPAAALQALGARGLTRVFCEGGGALAASLLSAGLVDTLITFAAGLALGAEGRPALGALGIDRLADAPRFDLRDLRRLGADAMLVWERRA